MQWNGPGNTPGAHAAYDRNDRCPVCSVPPGAEHMNSCDYYGVWDGALPGGDGWYGPEEEWDDDEEDAR
ncbi:hypothetical protein AB0J86_12340 [Micromonospora sp. NPDC049559]|uniref:hypothetical protein n=1 Tax=Micromonospora sp. NPDC049559 TaxID=3155923 RepID=UPI00342C039B